MRGSQLDRIEACLGQVLDDRRNVPVFRDVVGDGSQLQSMQCWLRRGLRRGLPNRESGNDRHGGEKIASIHAGKITPVPSSQLPVPSKRLTDWKLATGNWKLIRSRDQSETPVHSTPWPTSTAAPQRTRTDPPPPARAA